MSPKYPLATSSWDAEEYRAITRVIASDMFSMGAEVRTFEEQFAEYFGANYAVMVNSGSSANLLMTAALFFTKQPKLKRGDEVIVPAVSWSTTYFPLGQYGLHLKFVDVDRGTLNYDLDALAAAITDQTRAIMCVNLLGNPNNFARIKKIIGPRDIVFLEDNYESMGPPFPGNQSDTCAVLGPYRAYFHNHISTIASGLVATAH